MSAPRPIRSEPVAPSAPTRDGEAPASRGWRTQDRISRCRGLGYCVIEVHEFDLERPTERSPNVEYRVYAEVHGFPVGEAVASLPTLGAAQRHAESLGVRPAEGAVDTKR